MIELKEYNVQRMESTQAQPRRADIYIEGRLCAFLEVSRIVREGYPRHSWAVMRFSTARLRTGPHDFAPGEVQHWAEMGREVEIHESIAGLDTPVAALSRRIFTGTIEQMDSNFDANHWRIEMIAKDFSASLSRRMICGRRKSTPEAHWLDKQARCIFNENDRPNRSPAAMLLNGSRCFAFVGTNETAQWWNAAQAITWLLAEYVRPGELTCDAPWKLQKYCGDMILYHLDITSLSVFEAIGRICRMCGIGFRFEPSGNPVGPRQRIVFYQNAAQGSVELFVPSARQGEQIEPSPLCVTAVERKQRFSPVVQAFTGVGEICEYEATFPLLPGWNPALEGLEGVYYKRSAVDFETRRDVYRKWVLNEAGDYTALPYSLGPAYSLAELFDDPDSRPVRRRFYKCLTHNSDGESEGICLEVTYDGVNWHRYADSFRVLSTECGVWLSSHAVSGEIWQAWFDGKLAFRVTATIRADKRLYARCIEGPDHSCAPVVEHTIRLPRKFTCRRVTAQSIFYPEVTAGTRQSDHADDTAALGRYLRQYARSHPYVYGQIRVTTALPGSGFWPGQRIVTCPDGQNLLGPAGDDRGKTWIEKAVIDMDNQQTRLELARSRLEG